MRLEDQRHFGRSVQDVWVSLGATKDSVAQSEST